MIKARFGTCYGCGFGTFLGYDLLVGMEVHYTCKCGSDNFAVVPTDMEIQAREVFEAICSVD